MKLYRTFVSRASTLALAAALLATATAAAAQTADTPASSPAPANNADQNTVVVVTGIRNSLRSAQNIKKNASEVVDSIVAQDIGKLPDPNLADSLQRVPGVQLYRYAGEGLYAIVRGLVDQNRTEYNGRSYFSAGSASGGGRDFEQDNALPELISGIDVYKNPSSDHIEGAIGGLINIKTYKPFDFKGPTAIFSFKENYYDLAKKSEPTAFGLVSDRWQTSHGEFGALFAAGYQKTAMRQDSIGTSNNNFTARSYLTYGRDLDGNGVTNSAATPNADTGDEVMAPNGFNEQMIYGGRTRSSMETALEWRPNTDIRLYLDGNYTEYLYDQDSYNVAANMASAGAPVSNLTYVPTKTVITAADVAGNSALVAGTQVAGYDFGSGAFSNVTFTGLGDVSMNHFKERQIAVGGSWHASDRLDLSADLASSGSDDFNEYRALSIASTPGTTYTVTQNLTGKTQSIVIAGGNAPLANPANWNLTTYNKQYTVQSETETALRFDGKYRFNDTDFIKDVKAGARLTDLTFDYNRGNVTWKIADANGNAVPVSAISLWTNEFSDFQRGDTSAVTGFVSFNRGVLANDGALIASLPNAYTTVNGTKVYGITANQPAFDPTLAFEVKEKTKALYAMADFGTHILQIPVDGDIGARVVTTDGTTYGYNTAPQKYSYTNTLPSLNVKAHLTDNLIVRFGASKGVTRPPFASLNPGVIVSNAGITLGGTPTAGIGNPNLKAQRSNNLDLSAEWYFSRTGYTYINGFDKKINGFITNFADLETLPGISQQVLVTRPVNGGSGKVDGIEAGAQTFFDFLPSPWDGIGVQANLTHVDSKQNVPLGPTNAPVFVQTRLGNLSKNSYNLVLMYEKYGWTGRLAWGYRGDYLRSQFGGGTPNLPLWTPGYGSLDGSLSYDVNKAMTVTLDAANMTNSAPNRYSNNDPLRPVQQYAYDRRFAIAVHYKIGG